MRFATSPQVLHAGRDEREAKLKEFVREALKGNRGSQPAHITILARAPDSPVARALASLASELAAASVTVRAVMLDLDGFADEPGRPTLLELAHIEIRLLADPRFTAAHEQLVLSGDCMWLGDCMRRDPAKRDAFEVFNENNATAATHAAVSFSRLWNVAKPVHRMRPIAPELVIAAQPPFIDDAPGDAAPRG